MGRTHDLHPSLETMHGWFSRDLPPVLTVESGDTVRLHTLDVTWGLENQRGLGLERARLHRPEGDPGYDGPALLGPVAVRGALAGMTLRIDILEVATGPWGWTFAGGDGALNAALGVAGSPVLIRWAIDAEAGLATSDGGHRVPIRPFPGMIGLAPGEVGLHSGWEPRRTGGNMDCRELIAGTSLYLPIEAEGALLSAGDGHAAQGDGEVGGSAIECLLSPLTLRLTVEEGGAETPRIRTGNGWVFLGFGETVEAASHMALRGALDWISSRFGVDRARAAALASVSVSLRVTQMVNGVVGAHAVMGDGALWVPGSPGSQVPGHVE